MNANGHKVEPITFEKHGEFYYCWFSVDGEPAEDFTVHASVRDEYPVEQDFMAYLCRQAISLYEEFGSVRDRLYAPDPSAVVRARLERAA